MHNGFAIALAWPKTLCKRAGAWYDYPLHYLKISKNGYYKVGHAAVVLIKEETKECLYFDFGRYHAPYGHGRVRSVKTDHDLFIKTKAFMAEDSKTILNLNEILKELHSNPSTHGIGVIYGAVTKINFDAALKFTESLQQKESIPYGPFIPNGTNCSRFVSRVIQAGNPSALTKLRLKFPLTISPTPMWNLVATGKTIMRYDEEVREAVFFNEQSENEMLTL